MRLRCMHTSKRKTARKDGVVIEAAGHNVCKKLSAVSLWLQGDRKLACPDV
jgi:hypothetical protein